MVNVDDSVALVMDPEFRDRYYRARQYGRVLSVHNGKAMIDWSDVDQPDGPWLPKRPEQYAVGCLQVIYPASEARGASYV
ncbi:hypothetical protein [Mycobacterium phage WXIN]|nr:hypothetical protein [Mycobacterium phage WXIN]